MKGFPNRRYIIYRNRYRDYHRTLLRRQIYLYANGLSIRLGILEPPVLHATICRKVLHFRRPLVPI